MAVKRGLEPAASESESFIAVRAPGRVVVLMLGVCFHMCF